ncbi:MAG: sialidase family protein [Bryobacteraceae bacterium]
MRLQTSGMVAMGLALAAHPELLAQPGPPELSLQPPRVIESPGAEYAESARGAQGVPAIERTAKGRLWAAWYTGPSKRAVESPFSYVVLATSGDDGATWSGLKLAIQPPRFVRAMDPCLWIDPRGRLWLFWAQSAGLRDGRWGVWSMMTGDADSGQPRWTQPRRIANGIMLNKPTVLRNGDWLLPVGLWRDNTPSLALDGYDLSPYTKEMLIQDLGEERGSNVYRSRDQGETFEFLGQARVPPTRSDEHMLVERRDGTLWMLVRTTWGIGQSVSRDGGRTWSPGKEYMRGENVANKRFFIRRLRSGALLMVRNNGPGPARSHLTAFVSDDDGVSWKGGLLIEERVGASYPDGVESSDGRIYVVHDFDRAGEGVIRLAIFREEDVRARRGLERQSEISRLRLPDLAKQPPRIITAPGSEYAASARGSQGVPGIERTAKGRLWAIWVTGPSTRRVESPFSYAVMATSGDDGRTWSGPKVVIQPRRFVRAMSPCIWIDPGGRLWAFWSQSAGLRDGRWGVWAMVTEDPDSEEPRWSAPRRIADGVMLNKPAVLRNGDWLLPIGMWRDNKPDLALDGYDISPYTKEMLVHDMGEARGSNVYRSRDQGKTFAFLGQVRISPTRSDEHMLVELRDGRLWMLVRTEWGIGQSFSSDGGKTWSPGTDYLRAENVANKRFFVRRLRSGALLMVRHNGPSARRSHLTAFVSADDGASWQGGLLLDGRDGVSYPDGAQGADGTIYVIYDFDRAGAGIIQMAVFREEEARSGRASGARLAAEVSRLRR